MRLSTTLINDITMKSKKEKIPYKGFSSCLEDFFKEYLIRERGCSQKTLRTYRDAFVLLVHYLSSMEKVPPERISLEMFNRETVKAFLDWLEKDRHCSIRTRNNRLAAMKSFCRYLMYEDPSHLKQWTLVLEMASKKREEIEKVDSLSLDAVKAILQSVDASSRSGFRDLTLLSLLYNSAARVNELIDLMPKSIRLQKPYGVELFGKGSKRRVVPLDEPIIKLLGSYMKAYSLDEPGMDSHPLFFNRYHGKLTNAGITYLLKKYSKIAVENGMVGIPENIHPHMFRHSRACHLLQAGTNLEYIRLILGHASIQTTEIYAKVDQSATSRAIENAYSDLGLPVKEERQWQQNPKLLAMLKNLA